MAASLQSSVQDQIADVTECSICTEVYTNPKILPCVHTFCLECLEKYGTEKKTGDKMACPICRNEFLIPDGGFCSLPHNFFINKMVEIRKLSETSTNESLCGTCPGEEKEKAKLFCLECEQNLCERCSIIHNKMKLCQNHQVVEIESKLKSQAVSIRNSYCVQHPGELVKMYCEDDKATLCFLCFAESHQTHKCSSVTKASEEFSSALKNHLITVKSRLPEYKDSLEKLKKLKTGLLAETAEAEKKILNESMRLKALIDSHANIVMQKLTALKDKKLKEIDSMKEDLERFKVTIESYAKYSEEVLSKGAPGDICREADQLKTRARELASLTHFRARNFNGNGITFKSLNLEDVLRMNNIANVIGDVQDGSENDRFEPIVTRDAVVEELERISETVKNLKPHELDLIRAEEFKKKLKQELPDLEFEVKQTEVNVSGTPDDVKRARLYITEKVTAAVQYSIGIFESVSHELAKEGARSHLMEKLRSEAISASWMLNDRKVVVFALDDKNLKDAVRVLKNTIFSVRFRFTNSE